MPLCTWIYFYSLRREFDLLVSLHWSPWDSSKWDKFTKPVIRCLEEKDNKYGESPAEDHRQKEVEEIIILVSLNWKGNWVQRHLIWSLDQDVSLQGQLSAEIDTIYWHWSLETRTLLIAHPHPFHHAPWLRMEPSDCCNCLLDTSWNLSIWKMNWRRSIGRAWVLIYSQASLQKWKDRQPSHFCMSFDLSLGIGGTHHWHWHGHF